MSSASSSGDAGDICAGLLGTLHSIPGKHTVYLRDDGRTKGIVKREALIRPLIESQSYIEGCKVWKDQGIDWPSEKFREGFHSTTNTLLHAHASHAKSMDFISEITKGDKPWLTITPNKATSDRIIVSRSARYRNDLFPWRKVMEKYGPQLLFIGMPDEHQMFVNDFGPIDHFKTKNLLEVATAIAGSLLFIGNQSSPMAIAEGLKHPRIQETCLTVADCIYPGDGAQYVADGAVTLPGFGDEPTVLPSKSFALDQIHLSFVPKGGWLYDSPETGPVMTSDAQASANQVFKKYKGEITKEEALHKVLVYNVKRLPRFFMKMMPLDKFSVVHRALLNAGVTEHPLMNLLDGSATFDL